MKIGKTIPTDGLIFFIDPANPSCFKDGDTSCINLVTGGLVTGAVGTPYDGAHSPNPSKFPPYNSTNGGVFDFGGSHAMNCEEDLGGNYFDGISIVIFYYKNGGGTTDYFTDGRNDGGNWFLSNYVSYNINFANTLTYNFEDPYNASASDFINQWQCLMLINNRTVPQTELYINNELKQTGGSSAFSLASFGRNYRIGTRFTDSGRWVGYMGQILFYKRALNSNERNQVYNSFRSRYGL